MEHEHTHPTHEGETETTALLKYMAHHNAHHGEELLELAPALPENAARLVREAARLLEESAALLERALNETEG